MNPTTQHPHGKRESLLASRTLNPHPDRVSDALFQDREFFDRSDLLQVKYEMLRCVTKDGRSVAQAAEDFGFSRRHFYVIQKQFAEAGFQGLMPDKRGPRGAHKLDDEVMRVVMAALDDDPTLKASALACLIEREFQRNIHPRTIEKALARKKNRAAN
jgi:transposase